MNVELRLTVPADFDDLFRFSSDPVAIQMAAFTANDPMDRDAFNTSWEFRLANLSILNFTIWVDGEIAGSVATFYVENEREITYWIGREWWGRGIATEAVRQILALDPIRPMHGRAAADNPASRRVMEKCGFIQTGTDRGYANARGQIIDEVILRLD